MCLFHSLSRTRPTPRVCLCAFFCNMGGWTYCTIHLTNDRPLFKKKRESVAFMFISCGYEYVSHDEQKRKTKIETCNLKHRFWTEIIHNEISRKQEENTPQHSYLWIRLSGSFLLPIFKTVFFSSLRYFTFHFVNEIIYDCDITQKIACLHDHELKTTQRFIYLCVANA